MTAETLFDDYAYYRLHTRSFNPKWRSLVRSTERLETFDRMYQWCVSRNLDPRFWLYTLFHARHWTFAPKFDQLIPKTKATERKAIDRYKTIREAPLYWSRVRDMLTRKQTDAGTVYDPNRDISWTAEGLKQRYDPETCMSRMHVDTLGYHPKSDACSRCPLAQTCATVLRSAVPFDIVALRKGELSLDEARRIAGRHHVNAR